MGVLNARRATRADLSRSSSIGSGFTLLIKGTAILEPLTPEVNKNRLYRVFAPRPTLIHWTRAGMLPMVLDCLIAGESGTFLPQAIRQKH